MNQRWTLHVENFARIESADIEIAPLMCFIGDNNSGKSYIMTLLWGLLHHSWYFLFSDNNVALEKQQKCREWREKYDEKEFVITDEIAQNYVDLFNELLSVYKEKIVTDVFNKKISVGKIEIRHFRNFDNISVRCSPSELIIKDIELIFEIKGFNYQKWVNVDFAICWSLLMGRLTTKYPIEEAVGLPIYLPASRTGFLLARREINNASIGHTFSLPRAENKFQERFTAPYIQFLKILNSFNDSQDTDDEKKFKLAEFLQKEILHGSVRVKEDGKIIRYLPEDVEQELPMSITSSVVTEIASLLLLLTTRLPLRLIIIEEPEAHLHPALQKKIAQFLIRLVHNGVPVWITTHSDTILQHFNNMIKLNNRSSDDRKELLQEFNYSDEDLLNPDEISLYQFERDDKHTAIQKLESGKYGFVVPSFNKAIDKLMSEIFAFQEDEEDD